MKNESKSVEFLFKNFQVVITVELREIEREDSGRIVTEMEDNERVLFQTPDASAHQTTPSVSIEASAPPPAQMTSQAVARPEVQANGSIQYKATIKTVKNVPGLNGQPCICWEYSIEGENRTVPQYTPKQGDKKYFLLDVLSKLLRRRIDDNFNFEELGNFSQFVGKQVLIELRQGPTSKVAALKELL